MGRGTWIALVLLVAAVALGRAGSARADTFTACGDRVVAGGTVDNCLSIGDAVAAAIANPGPDTIELSGGRYCPIDFEDEDTGPITFIGLPPVVSSGESVETLGVEAENSAFEFDSPYCGGQTTGGLVTVENDPSPLVFENLAVVGGDGFYAQDATITLRNVVVENSSRVGLSWEFVEGTIDRSAIVNNGGDGADITATNGVTIVNSTFAGNARSGLYMEDFFDSHLTNDTIAGNALYGLTMSGSGTGSVGLWMVNTAITGNGSGDFEGADDCSDTVLDTVSLGHNVYGGSCWEFQNDPGYATDYRYTTLSPSFQALGANGGPTWTELPPGDETNAPHFVDAGDESSCPAIDQRGYGRDDGACDVGAVELGGDTNPNATLSSASVDFGDVPLGQTSTETVTLTNRGGAALDITGVTLTGGGFSIGTDTCSAASVDPGSTCSVDVTATPGSGAGSLSGSLSFADDAADSPQVVALSANGFAPPAAGFSASALDFGDVTDGATATRSVTVTNTGGGELDLELDGIDGADADLFQVGSGGCASLESGLGAGESCDVAVTFAPSGTGAASAVLSVYDSASGSENEIDLSGVGVAASSGASGGGSSSGGGGSSGGSSGGGSSGSGSGSGSGGGSSGGSTKPAPAPAPPAFYSRPAPSGAAGTLAVGTGSGHPTVAWQPRSFIAPVTVTAAPQAGSGFAVGGAEVKLTVLAADGSAVTSFSAPLELTFPNAPAGTVPAYSADGKTWTAMPELASDSLPPGFRDGWYRDPAGTIHILTMHATYFGLLAADAPATAEFTVSLGYPRRLALGRRLVVTLRSSLPGRAAVVLRRGSSVTAKRSGAVTAGATTRIALAPPRRTRAGGYRLTVVLTAGRERFARVVGVRLVAPRSK